LGRMKQPLSCSLRKLARLSAVVSGMALSLRAFLGANIVTDEPKRDGFLPSRFSFFVCA
jgi:hypothetical protein